MDQFYRVFDNNARAEIMAKFSVVQCLLQDEPRWGADVLEQAGEYQWRVRMIRRQSRRFRVSRIYPDTTERFIAFASVGKRAYLAYEIIMLDEDRIEVVPVGYLPTAFKVTNLVTLLLLMVLPVLLAPLSWRLYEVATLRYSRLYLDAFCRMVRVKLRNSAPSSKTR